MVEWKISKQQQKYIATLVLLGILGVVLIVIGNSGGERAEEKEQVPVVLERSSGAAQTDEERLEQQLAAILSNIEGVGNVQVKLTVEGSSEKTYAYNTQTTDKETIEGADRTTQEQQENRTVVMKASGQGDEEPLLVEESRPEITGVLVVAVGAEDAVIKAQMTEAVQTVLGIPAHKVLVLAGKR